MNDNFHDGSETRNQKLVEKYIMANKLHRMYLERELNKSGVYRSQHQILMFISKFPNASQKEIANRQHVSTATIAVSLKKMENDAMLKIVMGEEPVDSYDMFVEKWKSAGGNQITAEVKQAIS